MKLTKFMKTYTLKLFNTGQVTLPKPWRDKYDTQHFLAEEKEGGLFIRPLKGKGVVYYENKDGFGLYAEEGLPVDDIISKIQEIHGSD